MAIVVNTSGSAAIDYELEPSFYQSEFETNASYKIIQISLSFSDYVTDGDDPTNLIITRKDVDDVETEISNRDMRGIKTWIWQPNDQYFQYDDNILVEWENLESLTWTMRIRYAFFVDVSLWRTQLLLDFDNFTAQQIDEIILEAAREFCERSRMWVEDIDIESPVEGQAEYAFAIQTGQVIGIDYMTVDDEYIEPINKDELLLKDNQWRATTGSSIDYYLGDADRGKLRIYPIPDADRTESLKVGLIMKPLIDSSEIPDYLFTNHAEILKNGAKAKLLRQRKGKGDIQEAEYFEALFAKKIDELFSQQAKGFTKASLTTAETWNGFL